MLKTLTGEMPSPWGDRVYIYQPRDRSEIPPDARDTTYASQFGVHAFIHPGKWKLYGGTGGQYESAEAILDAGWLVE
jgi:hypothetical protein